MILSSSFKSKTFSLSMIRRWLPSTRMVDHFNHFSQGQNARPEQFFVLTVWVLQHCVSLHGLTVPGFQSKAFDLNCRLQFLEKNLFEGINGHCGLFEIWIVFGSSAFKNVVKTTRSFGFQQKQSFFIKEAGPFDLLAWQLPLSFDLTSYKRWRSCPSLGLLGLTAVTHSL